MRMLIEHVNGTKHEVEVVEITKRHINGQTGEIRLILIHDEEEIATGQYTLFYVDEYIGHMAEQGLSTEYDLESLRPYEGWIPIENIKGSYEDLNIMSCIKESTEGGIY